MPAFSSTLLSVSLIATGALGWKMAADAFVENADLQIGSNPLGIKKSPYGEVFAMAMQGPIDTYWHGGVEGHHHSHGDELNEASGEHDHDHAHCSDCEAAENQRAAKLSASTSTSLTQKFSRFLDELNEVESIRTNPKPVSPKHQFAIRREIENKLRFAYELDPSHYGNYNIYHLFLTEPTIGTRPELTQSSLKLADETISYCLNKKDDPRPALTAAAAAENQLLLMLGAPERFNTDQMRKVLQIVDHSLDQFHVINRQWVERAHWDHISEQRQLEVADRLAFVTKLRNTTEQGIIHLEEKGSFGTNASANP